MKPSYKNLLIVAIVLFVIGGAVTLMGALAKLQHWSWAGPTLTTGMVLHAISYLIGGYVIVQIIRKN
jgi:hypothetical protein